MYIRQDGDIATVSRHVLLAQAVCAVSYLPVSLTNGLIFIVERFLYGENSLFRSDG